METLQLTQFILLNAYKTFVTFNVFFYIKVLRTQFALVTRETIGNPIKYLEL